MRADGRYGQHDATLWPQPFLDKYPHLSVIPRKPVDPDTDMNALWWTPSRNSFRKSSRGGVVGVGFLVGPQIKTLKALKDSIKVEARSFLDVPRETPVLVKSFFISMIHSWVRLDAYPSTLAEKIIELAEFQRNWLELKGSLTFCRDIFPKLSITTEPEGAPLETLGCLTTSDTVAQLFYAVNLPVWLVRDGEKFMGGGVRIDKVVKPHKAETELELSLWPYNEFPPLYSGNASQPQRYLVQHQFTRSRMIWKDPWGDTVESGTHNRLEMGEKDVSSTTRTLDEMEAFAPVGKCYGFLLFLALWNRSLIQRPTQAPRVPNGLQVCKLIIQGYFYI